VPSSQACLSCHSEQRAEFSLPSHHPVKEGRIECADCRDPHRPVTEKIKLETCTKCHLQQRGPHIYEHGAISGNGLTDACLSCHVPHGSPNQRMLKLTNRGLCLQCHADRATHFPGRNCADCHQAVHGSNTSTLLFRE
jgi:DmsE family decaheme c-type cytochrome